MKQQHRHQDNLSWYKRLDYWLVSILLLAGFLNIWNLWNAGTADAFYTAAIKSGTLSWKAFFFGSIDPANYITVDKPPVALWIPELLGRIFGVNALTVTLPSALFGVATCYLIYVMIKPRWGAWAARISALVMTIVPMAVADNRVDNMDATLVFLCVLAYYFMLKAGKKQEIRYVFIAMATIGVAYNVKMMEAWMVVPGMFLYYFIAIKLPWKKLLVNFFAALAILGVTSLTYSVVVDAIPQSQRPWVGSTSDDSEISLSFGYNGVERLLGMSSGSGSNSSAPSGSLLTQASKKLTSSELTSLESLVSSEAKGSLTSTQKTQLTSLLSKAGITTSQLASALESNQSIQFNQGGPSGSGGNSAGGGLFNNGSVGLFRLFNAELGPTSSWFLPTALFGLFIGFFATRKRKSKWYALTDKQKEILLWAGWLIPVGGFFSVAGFFHSYYLDMMGAPIAALTGIAIVELVRSAKASKAKLNWAKIVGALLVLATYGVQASFTYSTYKIPTLVVGVLAIVIALAWLIPSKHGLKARAAASIAVLSIFTFWWALTPTLSSESAETPTVGPSLYQSGGQGASGGMGSNLDTNVLKYTEAHQGSATYLFATVSAGTSEPYIIQSGKAVMTLGGFSGSDPSITLAKFKTLVKEGKVKYFLAGGGSSSQISAIESWIEANAKKVTSVSSTSTSSTSSKTTSASSTAPTGTAPTGTAPTGSAPSGAPTASSSAKTTSSSTSSTSTSSTQSSGGPGGQQSTTLYDLTTITNFS